MKARDFADRVVASWRTHADRWLLASAATAFCAFSSCSKPSTAFTTTIAAITSESTGQPCRPSAAHSTNEMTIAASSR